MLGIEQFENILAMYFLRKIKGIATIFICCFVFTGNTAHSQELPSAHPFSPSSSALMATKGKSYGLDENGILYYDYGSRYNGLGKYSNPTFIAAYANALYREYLAGDKKAKSKFLRQVDYLLDHASSDKTGIFWSYPFKNEYFLAPVNWYSGMTSGRILGILIRAHALTGNDDYLDKAKKVFKKLSQKRELGGMTTYEDDQAIWIEEVAYPGSESFKILNGHIFGLAGVWDYANYIKDEEVISYLLNGIKAVEKKIDLFDSGYLSYYCENKPIKVHRTFAGRMGYNVIHVQQLLWLYKITGNSVFLKKAISFQFYEENYPDISVSHSTNEKTHGPKKMDLTFGSHYWSSNKFPVRIKIKLKRTSLLRGIVVLGHTASSTPRKFFIETSMNGKDWIGIAKEVDNTTLRKKIFFKNPVLSGYLQVTVYSDNGNRAVALDGIGLLYQKKNTPIVNFLNYGVGISRIFDSNLKTGFKVKNDGWILLPNEMFKYELVVDGKFNMLPTCVSRFIIERSDDLDKWLAIKSEWIFNNNKAVINLPPKKFKYYRIKFKKSFVERLNEIKFF